MAQMGTWPPPRRSPKKWSFLFLSGFLRTDGKIFSASEADEIRRSFFFYFSFLFSSKTLQLRRSLPYFSVSHGGSFLFLSFHYPPLRIFSSLPLFARVRKVTTDFPSLSPFFFSLADAFLFFTRPAVRDEEERLSLPLYPYSSPAPRRIKDKPPLPSSLLFSFSYSLNYRTEGQTSVSLPPRSCLTSLSPFLPPPPFRGVFGRETGEIIDLLAVALLLVLRPK